MNLQNKSAYKTSLKRRILLFVILGWFLPIEVIFLLVFSSYRDTYLEGTVRTIKEGVSSSAMLVSNRLDEAIKLMQKPSYERSWEPDWRRYRSREIGKYDFFISVNDSLKQNFYLDNRFDSYAFYVYGDGSIDPMCYSSRAGVTYENYMEKIHPTVYGVMQTDSNYVEVHIIENKVFLIRNLYTISDYSRYGTLVVSLNTEKLMSGFPMEEKNNVVLGLNNTEELLYAGRADDTADAQDVFWMLQEGFAPDARGTILNVQNGSYSGYLYQRVQDNYSIGLYYVVHRSMMQMGLREKYWIAAAVTVGLMLVTLYAFRFLKKHIENPIQAMVEGSREVESGKIGTTIEVEPMPNAEFEFLAESFNKMSEKVKQLFDTVYTEQLARKDAQIAALQAQINPHFLYNTLDAIGWLCEEERSQDAVEMVNALARLFRISISKGHELIPIQKEVEHAGSYLKIQNFRYKNQFTYHFDVEESCLPYYCNKITLQPIIENAIYHGIDRMVDEGKIEITIREQGEDILFSIRDNGVGMTREQCAAVLNKEPGDQTGIGIKNVNDRIKIYFGEKYGIQIESELDEGTCVTICMPKVREGDYEER